MPAITGDETDPDRGAAVQVLGIDFGDGHLEAPPHLSHQRPDQRALPLQGVDVAQQEVKLGESHPHSPSPAAGG